MSVLLALDIMEVMESLVCTIRMHMCICIIRTICQRPLIGVGVLTDILMYGRTLDIGLSKALFLQ
jgi:hypothetical protein